MGNINVSYSQLATIAGNVRGYLEEIETLKSECSAAGEEAVTAGGGDTRVATAIRSAVVEVSDNEFNAVKDVIEAFAVALEQVSKLYNKFDDEMYEGIKAIADKRQSLLESQAQTTNTQ